MNTKTTAISKRGWLLLAAAVLTVSIIAILLIVNTPSLKAEEITVYKSASCGCCNKWIDHLEANGFKVTAHNRNDMPNVKRQLGIAQHYQSCHTAVVNGYVIEGHVPASDIKKLLSSKPALHGLSVPGMPVGSPGMEGDRVDPYAVVAIDKQGKASVFNRYP